MARSENQKRIPTFLRKHESKSTIISTIANMVRCEMQNINLNLRKEVKLHDIVRC